MTTTFTRSPESLTDEELDEALSEALHKGKFYEHWRDRAYWLVVEYKERHSSHRRAA
jgi:hypothetical protein